jgi:hypothetical protein
MEKSQLAGSYEEKTAKVAMDLDFGHSSNDLDKNKST